MANNIKAIFFDEWYGERVHDELRNLKICWIATSISCKRDIIFKSLRGEFQFLHLSTNLRNTKEIYEKSIEIAGQVSYTNAFGILQPPEKFPVGNSVVYNSSLEEAIDSARSARSSSSNGILVIVDPYEKSPISLSGSVKHYYHKRNDFQPTESPFQLLKNGGILITSSNFVSGFDWPVVVYERSNLSSFMVKGMLDIHECNVVLRCTTKLFLCGDVKESKPIKEHFVELSKLMEISPDDNPLLISLKNRCKNVVDESYDDKWINELIPVLEKTLKKVELANAEILSNEDVFALHESLFWFIWFREESLADADGMGPFPG